MRRVIHLARRHGIDVLVVCAAIEAALEVALRHDAIRGPRTSPWFAVPAVAVIVLVLLGRRRFPFASPAVLWLLGAVLSFIDGRLMVFTVSVYLAGIAAAFLIGDLPDTRQARIGFAVTVAAAAIVVFNDPSHEISELLFVPMVFAVAWLAGFALRVRSTQAEAAEQRAVHAERERESAARVAVAEERARITRELHDIVAHAVSVMVLQVGAVRHKLPTTMPEDKDALRDVEQTGRSALSEMRRLLGAMHTDGDDVERAPQPSLDDIDALVRRVRHAGLPVDIHIEGTPCPLPRAIDLSAYRIVQEALTNSLKHAHATHVDVIVRYQGDGVQLEVRDDGVGSPAASDGFGRGLVGVRERVKIYGGEMTAGAAPGGGFVLSARLPLDGSE